MLRERKSNSLTDRGSKERAVRSERRRRDNEQRSDSEDRHADRHFGGQGKTELSHQARPVRLDERGLNLKLMEQTQSEQNARECRQHNESLAPIGCEQIRKTLEMQPDDINASSARDAERSAR